MNAEEQRIAIAQACGWTDRLPDVGRITLPFRYYNTITEQFALELPDYLNDLNAMHEAEKSLPNINHVYTCYAENLATICLGEEFDDLNYLEVFEVSRATATQRAEAFLKTLGLWRE